VRARLAAGVTLVELVVTIALLGILAAVAAVYVAPALEAYFSSRQRAQLADVADTSMRFMMREVRLALPNSARVASAGGDRFLEILLTKNGGRYRAANAANTGEVPLDFTGATQFDTLGPVSADPGDFIVIHNLGIPGADAYAAGATNRAEIQNVAAGTLAGESRITLTANADFPLESPGRRFFVVEGPVTYRCEMLLPAPPTFRLVRWSGYAIQAVQPVALPAGATQAVLAENLAGCQLDFASLPLVSRGLVAVTLTFAAGGDAVTLYYEAHISNVP
jgi:MSHA biogenesis protein MshO